MAFDISRPDIAAAALSNTASSGDITVRIVDDIARWDALIAAAPEPHLPQDYAYSCGKTATGWPARRVVFLADGRPVAFTVVLQLRRYGIGLFNRVNRGPIFLNANPSDEQIVAVYKALRPEAERAAELAIELANGRSPRGEVQVEVDGARIPSFLLEPVAVTRERIGDVVIADGFFTLAQLCTPDYASACAEAGLR